MAKKKTAVEDSVAAIAAAGEQDMVPTFTLRADRAGHLRALIAAAGELREDEQAQALRVIREFELHEEASR